MAAALVATGPSVPSCSPPVNEAVALRQTVQQWARESLGRIQAELHIFVKVCVLRPPGRSMRRGPLVCGLTPSSIAKCSDP